MENKRLLHKQSSTNQRPLSINERNIKLHTNSMNYSKSEPRKTIIEILKENQNLSCYNLFTQQNEWYLRFLYLIQF